MPVVLNFDELQLPGHSITAHGPELGILYENGFQSCALVQSKHQTLGARLPDRKRSAGESAGPPIGVQLHPINDHRPERSRLCFCVLLAINQFHRGQPYYSEHFHAPVY